MTEVKAVQYPPVTNTSTRTGTVNTAVLNIRSTPSTRSKILGTLKRNSIVSILSTSGGWHAIKLSNGKTAYVSGSFIVEKKTTTTSPVTKLTSKKGVIKTAILNIRSSPTTNSKIIGALKRNVTINILYSTNGWHAIKLATGQTGYISGQYVTVK